MPTSRWGVIWLYYHLLLFHLLLFFHYYYYHYYNYSINIFLLFYFIIILLRYVRLQHQLKGLEWVSGPDNSLPCCLFWNFGVMKGLLLLTQCLQHLREYRKTKIELAHCAWAAESPPWHPNVPTPATFTPFTQVLGPETLS